MSKLLCISFMVLSFSVSILTLDDVYDIKDNVLSNEGFTNEEFKETNLISKCYDEETKTAYKIDFVWHPKGKCEKRTCSRQNDSKTPIIKIMECQPCSTCRFPNEICHPFRIEKNYPKCCPQCLTKTVILKKIDMNKKYKTV